MSESDQASAAAEQARRLADYSMAFSLLGDLASARREAQAIERVLGLFTTLCAPARSAYLQVAESGPALLVALPHHARANVDVNQLASASGRWALTSSGRGFILRIDDPEGMLGVLEVDDVAFPARIEHYVNLGLGLIAVCALAIRNARAYERLDAALVDLQQAVSEVKALRGILPICAACKRIRDDAGAWSQVEVYVAEHSDAQFTHGICPACATRLYGDALLGGDLS